MNYMNVIFIISLLGFFGMGALAFRKISVLSSLPETENKSAVSEIKEGIKKVPFSKSFSGEIILHKIISQIRVLSLKADNKTFMWLKALREKNQQKRLKNENYWDEIQNSTRDGK